jgi:phosphinothricin acetyltransferase
MKIHPRPMTESDWPAVGEIYAQGIATGEATFETEIPAWSVWDRSHLPRCRLVAESADGIVGWAALSPVSSRCVYGGVAEVSVYTAERARGRGVGRALLTALVEESEREGLWSLRAGMFPSNVGSVALHQACGFREVGCHEGVGQLGGVWRDVLLMERRSKTVGVDR